MTKNGIIKRVKVLMEELTPFDDGLIVLNSDVKPIESYIEEAIQPALDQLLIFCPLHLTTAANLPTMTSVVSGTRKIGYITIPDDFLRIHTIKINNWEKAVHRAISVENPEYALQQNPFTRGGSAKPVVAKADKLELYTLKEGDTVEKATYIQRPDIEDLNLNQKLFEPACHMIAAEVLAIFGSKQAEYMAAKAQELIKAEL